MATETRRLFRRDQSLTALDYVAIVLAATTGLVHFYEGVEDWGEGTIAVLFVLAGVGFFVAISFLLLGVRKRAVYVFVMVHTSIQFVAYFVLRWPDIYEAIGLFDKAVQLLLIVVLAVLYRRTGRA